MMRLIGFRKQLIILGLTAILVGLVACKATSTPTTTTTSSPTSVPTQTSTSPTKTSAQSVTINLTAQGFSFDQNTITVPAGTTVTIHFTNKDNAPHNFAIYETAAVQKPIFVGQIITGPSATIDYKFTAPITPGTYFFRCDVHPSMNGSFIVQ